MSDRRRSVALSALAAVFLLAPAALAQTPAGNEFVVAAYSTEWGYDPSVAMDPTGRFVVVWDGGRFFTPPRARWFDSGGVPLGSERQMDADIACDCVAASVAADRNATMVDWGRGLLEGQMFTPESQPVGSAFQISKSDYSLDYVSPVAAVPGGFVVVWVHYRGPDAAVLGRRFDRYGQSLGPAFMVGDYAQGVETVAMAASEHGDFVVAWSVHHGAGSSDILGQRMSASGTPRGTQFRVNEATTGSPSYPCVTSDDAGNFVVVWRDTDVRARRFDSTGSPLGSEFVVIPPQPHPVARVSLAGDSAGNFTVVWDQLLSAPPNAYVFGQRFSATGAPRGPVFTANVPRPADLAHGGGPAIGDDGHGNFVVVWAPLDGYGPRKPEGRRFGGLVPEGLSVADGNNAVLEVGDTFAAATAWRNVNGAAQTFQGHSSDVTVPASLTLQLSPDANYGTVANGAVGPCLGPCFAGTLAGSRPAGHVDASFRETIAPDALGQTQRWRLHVGASFADVPPTNPFYRFVETLLHRNVTSGCAASAFCPAGTTTREQMSAFVLAAKEGAGYAPPACTTPVFSDVPASSPFCSWIEELARRGVTSGCGGGNYCPSAAVSREQMAVFVLRTLDPALDPPACTTPVFNDVPAASPFCRWIEELVRRGIVSGCGGGNYCPTAPVTREQMAVFLTGTFGLTLYGP
jgi:hypothetical protein